MTSIVRHGIHINNRFLNRIPFCVGIVWLQVMSCGHPDKDVVAEVGRYRIEAGALRSLVADLLPGPAGRCHRRRSAPPLPAGDGRRTPDASRSRKPGPGIPGGCACGDPRSRRQTGSPVISGSGDSFRTPGHRGGRQSPVRAGGVRPRASVQRSPGCRPGRHGQRACSPGGGAVPSRKLRASIHSTPVRQLREASWATSVQGRSPNSTSLPICFRSLPAGKVSPPIPAGRGAWQVFRFTDERGVPFARHRAFIETLLQTERRTRAERQHLERLQESFEARLNATGLRELIEAYGRRQIEDLPASTTALYLHDQGAIGVAEANEALRAANLRRAFAGQRRRGGDVQRRGFAPLPHTARGA